MGGVRNEIVIAPEDRLLTTGEVGKMLRVRPLTVAAWCRAGKLPSTRTLGGHRRVRYGDVIEIMERRAWHTTATQARLTGSSGAR